MKLALLSGKGGSGKTTVSILLYLAFTQAGHSVKITDLDPQRTITRWLDLMEIEQVNAEQASVEILDCPPRLDITTVREAIHEADKIILPARPGPADLWTTQDTVAYLKDQKATKKGKILWNCVRPGTLLSRDLENSTTELGLSSLPAVLSLRECFQHIFLRGWPALDAAAREEAAQVALSVTA